MEQQEIQQPYPFPQPMPSNHSTESSLRYQLDVSEILEELEHKLRGEVLITDLRTNQLVWRLPDGLPPFMNQIGIHSIMTILGVRLTKIFILSDFDEGIIENVCEKLAEDVIDHLLQNWDYYEIRDDTVASMIVNTVVDAVYATMRKGFGRNYLMFLRSTATIQEIQHRNLNDQSRKQESDGLIATLLRRRK